jgi:hypothetical protein
VKPTFPSKDEWFEKGTYLVKNNPHPNDFVFHDVTSITAPVLPAVHPNGLHFYKMDGKRGGLFTTAYVVKSVPCSDIQAVNEYLHELSRDNTVYLLCLFTHVSQNPNQLVLRMGSVSVLPEYSYYKPMPPIEILKYLSEKKMDLSMYPHTCPFCGSRAFIGFNQVDCMEGCR